MGAQQLAFAARVRRQKERIVHVARRMVGRKVELAEIVIVGLDVGPLGDRKAEVGEDRGDLLVDVRKWVDAADVERAGAGRQRHIDRLRG